MSGFVKLTTKQIEKKIDFIKDFTHAENPATGAKLDSNANVTMKNMTSMACELNKDINIQVNRKILYNKISKLFDVDTADEYIRQLEEHEIYAHDETSLMPYCVAISMYPFLISGMKTLGGESQAPKHLHSFCGSFVNLIYSVACQFAGACLHGSQRILVTENGRTDIIPIKELVSRFNLDHSFESDGSVWEYADVSKLGLFVAEDGKNVAINKVYRRKYNGDIYNITTKTGLSIKCSKDHKFKHLYRERVFETKAENLQVGDTLFVNKDYSYLIDKTSDDYVEGQVFGILCGDGSVRDKIVRVSVNAKQTFIMDFLDENLERFGIKNKGTRRYDSRGEGCWSYYIGSTNVCNKIKEMLTEGKTGTYDKNVDLSDKSLNWCLGFLDGLLVTDGSYSKAHFVTISMTNKGLIENVQYILGLLNKNKNITSFKPKIENRHELYKIGVPVSVLKYLSLTPMKPTFSSIANWESRETHIAPQDELYYIGKNAGKSIKSNVVATNKTHRRNDFVKCDVIASIETEKNDDEYVYELETETHWYNAGGFITHNCATVEFLTYFDYFARKDYGDNYLKTNKKEITDLLQQVVYCLNQPAGARNYQSTFWNISLFDKNYFDSLFGNFYFPDFTQPSWKSVQKLQNFFMQWFNEERTKALLTFPVVTAAMVVDKEKPLDEQFARDRAKDLSEGNSFFIYESDSVDSLSSCCRLRNEVADNDFSYSLGAGGVKSGSINVITINFNRLIQNVAKSFMTEKEMDKDTMLKEHKEELIERIKEEVKIQVEKIQKYQVSYRSVMESYKAHKMLPVYDAGFIDLDKQFLTTGINGMVEGCEYLGYEISDNQPYKDFVSGVLKVIYDTDKAGKAKYGYKFNTEYVPAENLGVKNSKWDREAGLEVPRDCYNSYFYKVEDNSLNIIDKFRLHGGSMISYLDGGSALHLNLREYPDAEQYYKMMCIAATEGCNYWTTNIMATVCESCGHIDKHTLEECPSCGSKSISYATRIIGYLKKISNFGKDRQIEAAKRYYH